MNQGKGELNVSAEMLSFLICSILATDKVTHLKLYHDKDKSQTVISNKQHFENEAFKVGFVLLREVEVTAKLAKFWWRSLLSSR